MRISEPLPSGGNTNDGNTARRFFADPDATASITGLSAEVIHRLGTILRTISSKLPVNVEAFAEYADQTRIKLTELYPFYPLSPTVHRLLIHGPSIIRHCLLPIGMMSEEVQERRNKSVRNFREFHSRKFNRLVNIEDVYKRLLLTSDPMICLNNKNKKTAVDDLPIEVQNLLLI